MLKKIFLTLLLNVLDGAAAAAAQTPNPLDDMIIMAIREAIQGMLKANNREEVLAALDGAKAKFNLKFPAPKP